MSASGGTRAAIAVATTLLLWASAFAGIRAGLHGYDAGALVLLRFLIASAVLAVYGRATGVGRPGRRDMPSIMLMGLLGITVYQIALTYGEKTVDAGSASFLVAAAPVITAVFAATFLGERLSAVGWAGIAAAFAGVGLIAFGGGEGLTLKPGALLVLLAAVATSAYFILQKRLLSRYSALALTSYGIWAGTVPMLVFMPSLVRQVARAPLGATLAVAYLGVFPAAIAYVTWAYALSQVTASRAAGFLFLSPVLATLIAWLWLAEQPGPAALAGGLLTLAGVVMVNSRGHRVAR